MKKKWSKVQSIPAHLRLSKMCSLDPHGNRILSKVVLVHSTLQIARYPWTPFLLRISGNYCCCCWEHACTCNFVSFEWCLCNIWPCVHLLYRNVILILTHMHKSPPALTPHLPPSFPPSPSHTTPNNARILKEKTPCAVVAVMHRVFIFHRSKSNIVLGEEGDFSPSL